jgi:hypothetical protein
LRPPPGGADPTQRLRTRFQLVNAVADGGLADLGRPRDSPNPAMPQGPGLGPHQQTALMLVQVWEQHRESHGELISSLLRYAHTTSTSQIHGSNTLILCEL